MPETICQICGTPNPPDAVICSTCHSRLGPPPGRTQSLDTPGEQPSPGKENLEWLERVRELNAQDQLSKSGGFSASVPPSIPTPIPEAEVENPDWLHNTRDLAAAQKPPNQTPAGEDLSWLNELRASTGSLTPPPAIPTNAAEVLAAAAFAKHQEEMEDTEHLGETQQLAPRSSIPGSASDWLDKLGALGENEQLKPGFEDSFGSPPAEIGTVVNYDIDRATGSLGKPEETVVPVPASLEPVPPPIEPAATPPVVENIPPAQVPEATAPRPEQVPGQSAAPAAGLDLAFLDSMLAETPVAEAPFEHEAGVLPSQPAPINENVPSEVPSAPPSEPSLSWLQELQNLPEPQSAQTLEPSIEAAASPPAEILEFIPTPPPVVAEGMPKLDLSVEEPGVPPLPAAELPSQFTSEELDARLLNQFAPSIPEEIKAPPTPSVPPAPSAPPPQPSQELKSMPGFSSTGLTGFLGSDALAEMGMEGILPPERTPASTPASPPPAPPPIAPAREAAPPTIIPSLEIPAAQPPMAQAGFPDGSIQPPAAAPKPPAAQPIMEDPLFHPPASSLEGIQLSEEPYAGVQSVDLGSLQPSEETPDWLKQYASEFKVDENQASLFPSQEELSKVPASDSGIPPASPQPPAAPSQTEKYTADVSAPLDFTVPEPQPVVPAAAEIQNQDWLNTVINETPASPADLFKDVEEPRFAAPEEELPAQPAQDSKPPAWVMEPGQHSGFTGPLPDWLQELEGDQEVRSSPAAQEEIIPDLFVSPSSTAPAAPEPEPKEERIGIEAAVVPGLSDLGIQTENLFQSPEPQGEALPPHKEPSLEDLGIHPEEFFPSKEPPGETPLPQPDWLSSLPAMQDGAEPAPVQPEPGPSQFKKDETPSAAASVLGVKAMSQASNGAPPQNAGKPSPAVPFGMESLPDWISAEHGDGESSDGSPDQPALAQAEMPGWLEALKPVGMAKAALSTSQPATPSGTPVTGSLKTTTGSLGGKPSAPSISQVASPAPGPKTENQKQYAAMMEQVLTRGPAQAAPAPGKKKRSRKVLWIVIAGLAVILVLVLAAVGLGFLPLPQLFSTETVTFYNTVETLPPDAPVLIALEYSPAFAAELQPVSEAVMEQLALKHARVSFISTQPAGPILAEQLLQEIHNVNPSYDLAANTANLGYLAGGSTALQGFSLNPASVTQTGWDGQPAWNKNALAGINNLSQFAAILVISENADISRDWIEQVQPKLGGVPLLIATSAQTGPLLQPYTASGQVDGLVAGISGAAAYENILGKPAQGSALWQLYLAAQILAVLVILLGLVLRISRDRKKLPGGEG